MGRRTGKEGNKRGGFILYRVVPQDHETSHETQRHPRGVSRINGTMLVPIAGRLISICGCVQHEEFIQNKRTIARKIASTCPAGPAFLPSLSTCDEYSHLHRHRNKFLPECPSLVLSWVSFKYT